MLRKSKHTNAMVRGLLLTVLLLALPTFAHAWTLYVQVSNGDGSHYVTVGSNTTQLKSGTTSYNVSSTIAANTIKVFGSGATVTLDGATFNPVTNSIAPPVSPATSRTVQVTFTTALYNVSVALPQPTGGTVYVQETAPIVTAYSTSLTGLAGTATVVVSVYPQNVYKVTGIMVNGVSKPMTPASPVVGQITTYTLTAAELQTNPVVTATLTPSYTVTAALYISPSTVSSGTAVTLNSSGTTTNDTSIASYAFSLYSSPSYPVITPNNGSATLTAPTTAGTYKVRMVATSTSGATGTATSSFNVLSAFDSIVNYCTGCHTARNPDIVAAYLSSYHYLNKLNNCANCHNPGLAIPHPGVPLPIQSCSGCHLSFPNTPGHLDKIGTNVCVQCHDPHNQLPIYFTGVQVPHYNNITTGMYPANFVTSRAVCSNCHSPTNDTEAAKYNRYNWYSSAHGAITGLGWIKYDYKTMDGCVRCHTTTGFLAYSTGKVTAAWGVASDKTKEVLRCYGCHSDITNGIVRTLAPLRPYANDSYANPDVGESNVCMRCHTGTNSGQSVKAQLAAGADFTSMAFIDSHYQSVGGEVFGSVGYLFAGSNSNTASGHGHASVGIANYNNTGYNGPCVGCHKNSAYGHKFKASATVAVCANCHTGLSDAQLALDKAAFANALEVLRAMLASKGFVYSPTPPFFSNTNWGAGQAGADTMGAAFNYALLANEPGAYLHNPSYAKQLVLDSIDYLDNGVIDNSVQTVAVPQLVAANAISPATAMGLVTFQTNNSCMGCHGASSPSSYGAPVIAQAPHFSNISASYTVTSVANADATCSNCHVVNNAANAAARQQWAQSLHGDTNGVAWKGDSYKTKGAQSGQECVRCHTATGYVNYVTSAYTNTNSFGDPADPTKEVLSCNACHQPDYSRRVLAPYSSATTYSFKVNSTTVVTAPYRYSDYATSNICMPCHTGTTSGEIVKKAFTFASFTSAGRLLNHFMASGGILDNNIGYEYAGTPLGNYQDYNKQNTWHAGIGTPNQTVNTGTDGPCVGCHMSAPNAQHTFKSVTKDATGTITAVASQNMCNNCHPSTMGGGDQMTAAVLASFKGSFSSTLAVLKAQLQASGFDPDSTAPKNWGTTPVQSANNMGAYYNYFLLRDSDVGSYVHNPTYVKRLVLYSLDWLDDSTFNDSVYSTINALSNAGRISTADRDGAISYLGVDPNATTGNCNLCHRDYYN